LINIILMGGAFWWLFTRWKLDPSLMSHVPDWLQWLNYLLWPVVVISVLLVFGYFFSTIANWIAAPFNGLLAEQLEARYRRDAAGHGRFGHHERYAAHHEA
jgi:CysZ protein